MSLSTAFKFTLKKAQDQEGYRGRDNLIQANFKPSFTSKSLDREGKEKYHLKYLQNIMFLHVVNRDFIGVFIHHWLL